MGSSQSTPNETDTTEVILESDDDGEVKISKRHLSREELDNLSAELEKNISDKNVTIDLELYKSIGADLGYEFEEDEEEEDQYYDEGEVEAYQLVEPIETPDNFSMVPGINQMGTVDALDLGPPLFTELTPPVDKTPTLTNEAQNIEDNQVISNGDNRVSEKTDNYIDAPPADTSSDTELSESDISTSHIDTDREISDTNLTTEKLSEDTTNIRSPSHDTELTTESNISPEVEDPAKKSESCDTPVEYLESVDLSADESEPEVSSTEDTKMSDTSSKAEVPEVVAIDTVPLDDGPSTSTSVDLGSSQEVSSEETLAQEISSEETLAQEISSEETIAQEISSEETITQEISSEKPVNQEISSEETLTPEAPSELEVVTVHITPDEIPVIPVDDSVIISENLAEDLAVVPEEPIPPIIISETDKEATEVRLPDAYEPAPDVPAQEIPIPEVPVESTIERKQELSSSELQSAKVVVPISSDTEATIGDESLNTSEEPTSESEPVSPLISTVSDVESSDTADHIAVADSVDEISTLEEVLVQIEPVGVVAEDEVLGILENVVGESAAVEEEAPTSEPSTDSSPGQDLTDNVVQEESITEPASTPLSAVEAEPQDSIETVEEVEPEATHENVASKEVEVEQEPPTIAVIPVTEELEIISESLSPEEPVITEPAIPDTVLPGPVAVDHALLEPVVPLTSVEEPDASVDVAPPVIEEEQVVVVTEEESSSEEKVASVEQDVVSDIVPEKLPVEDVVVHVVEQTDEKSESAEESVPLILPSEPEEIVPDVVEKLPEPIETVLEPLESTSEHVEAVSEPAESTPVPVETYEPVENSETAPEHVEKEVESVEISTQSVGTSTESLEAVTQIEESVPEAVAESESVPTVSESAGGLFGLIQKAIEPYFAAIKEETVPEESSHVSVEETTSTVDNVPEPATVVETSTPEPETSTNSTISPVVEVRVEPVIEHAVETVEPVAEPVIEPVIEPSVTPATEPLSEPVLEVNELPQSDTLAQSLFGEYKKQEVEKIITEAKVEGARNQARIDADVMSNALNTERSRWRGRFSVIESNLNKRKQDIGSAHEDGFALVTSKLQIPETKETCSDSVSEIVDCYLANPDKVLRCNQIAQSFDSCVNKALSSR